MLSSPAAISKLAVACLEGRRLYFERAQAQGVGYTSRYAATAVLVFFAWLLFHPALPAPVMAPRMAAPVSTARRLTRRWVERIPPASPAMVASSPAPPRSVSAPTTSAGPSPVGTFSPTSSGGYRRKLNSWTAGALPMTLQGGTWKATANLSWGSTVEYKFWARWNDNPNYPLWANNPSAQTAADGNSRIRERQLHDLDLPTAVSRRPADDRCRLLLIPGGVRPRRGRPRHLQHGHHPERPRLGPSALLTTPGAISSRSRSPRASPRPTSTATSSRCRTRTATPEGSSSRSGSRPRPSSGTTRSCTRS